MTADTPCLCVACCTERRRCAPGSLNLYLSLPHLVIGIPVGLASRRCASPPGQCQGSPDCGMLHPCGMLHSASAQLFMTICRRLRYLVGVTGVELRLSSYTPGCLSSRTALQRPDIVLAILICTFTWPAVVDHWSLRLAAALRQHHQAIRDAVPSICSIIL